MGKVILVDFNLKQKTSNEQLMAQYIASDIAWYTKMINMNLQVVLEFGANMAALMKLVQGGTPPYGEG